MTTKYCKIIGCEKVATRKGWCDMHYRRWKNHGDPLYKQAEKRCSECWGKIFKNGLCRECYERKQLANFKGRLVDGKKLCLVCDGPHYGNGFCKKHYNRLRNNGNLSAKKVSDLDGEEWLPVAKDGFEGIFVSSRGRAKSCKKRDEVLLKTQMKIVGASKAPVLIAYPGGLELRVGRAVLLAFGNNEHDDATVVFKDGNGGNCAIENLAWYGRNYLIGKRIKEAELSNHPLADCFLRFWHGEHQVINGWLESLIDPVRAYLYRCFDRSKYWNLKHDLDDFVQQTLYDIFIALYRGMFAGFEAIKPWVFTIAGAVFKRFLKIRVHKPLNHIDEYGRENSLADIVGFTHPSAELVAICHEERIYA